MSYLERLKNKKASGGSLPKPPKPTKPPVSAVLAVSAVPHAAHLKIISKDDAPTDQRDRPAHWMPARSSNSVVATDTMPAAEGVTPPAHTPPPKPINRAVLRFTLLHGGGTVLGQPDDTAESLLADLRERWPGELLAVWNGDELIYPRPPLESG